MDQLVFGGNTADSPAVLWISTGGTTEYLHNIDGPCECGYEFCTNRERIVMLAGVAG